MLKGAYSCSKFNMVLTKNLLVLGILFGSEVALANVYIEKGEGGRYLRALIDLGSSNQISLGVESCIRRRAAFDLLLGLYVDSDKKIASELEGLRDQQEEAKKNLYVCFNDICEQGEWTYLPTGFGDAFSAKVSIAKRSDPIRIIRVIIPNESIKYEYRGDIDLILKRICR